MQPDNMIVYELKGKSLEAVHKLNDKIRSELIPAMNELKRMKHGDQLSMIKVAALVTPLLMGRKPEIEAAVKEGLKTKDPLPLLDAFQDKYKDLYDAVGQNARAVQVRVVEGTYPRAYAHTPTCYYHPVDRNRVYMFSPVDYKGDSFKPQDAVALGENQTKHITLGLWANGHTDPIPAVHRVAPYGIATPADFDAQSPAQNCVHQAAPFNYQKVQHVLASLERCKTYMLSVGAIEGAKYEWDCTFDSKIVPDENGRPTIIARALNLKNNTALTVRANACFTPEPLGDGFYKMLTTPKTAGGMAMQSIIDTIPPLSAGDIWLMNDAQDREFFTPPPPLPPQLADLYTKAQGTGPKPTPAP